MMMMMMMMSSDFDPGTDSHFFCKFSTSESVHSIKYCERRTELAHYLSTSSADVTTDLIDQRWHDSPKRVSRSWTSCENAAGVRDGQRTWIIDGRGKQRTCRLSAECSVGNNRGRHGSEEERQLEQAGVRRSYGLHGVAGLSAPPCPPVASRYMLLSAARREVARRRAFFTRPRPLEREIKTRPTDGRTDGRTTQPHRRTQ